MIPERKVLRLFSPQLRSLSYWKARNWYASLVKPKTVDPPYAHIIQVGDPRLRSPCEPIPVEHIKSPEIKALIKTMQYVFHKYNCIGLSAPQIGIPLKIFLMAFTQAHAKQYPPGEFKNKEMSLVPFTVVVNPEVKITDYAKVVYPESCESVKGFWADVPRYRGLQLSAYDENGERINVEAVGWVARIIQHEIDHLNGKLYTDVMDRKSLTCTCWEAVNERRGKVILPYYPN